MRKKIGLMMIILISMMLLIGSTVFATEPILMKDNSSANRYILGNSSISQRRTDIAKISIETSIPSPLPDEAWDVSKAGNGSVYAYLTENETDNTKYDLHIAGNGGVKASSGRYLFAYYKNCKEISGISNLDVSSVTDMESMFVWCSSLTNLDLGEKFDTSSVTTMWCMFSCCESLKNLDLGEKFDTSSVTTMVSMFSCCESLTNLDLGEKFDTSSVTTMMSMFSGCESLTNLDLGEKFDTSKVTQMREMFQECSSLTNLDLGEKFNTSSVTSMYRMFNECSSLTSIPVGLDLSNTNVESETVMYSGFSEMFCSCTSLTSAKVNSKYIGYWMFYNCYKLTKITITSNVQGVYANSKCFYSMYKLSTTLINESSAMENYDWSADNRAVTIVVPDTIAPTGTISLGSRYYEANGYKYVKSNEVIINLTASDDISEQSNIKVALINEKDYSRTNSNSSIKWLSFSPSIQWTASSGKGLKRVYVIFKDEAGNQSLYLAT